LGGGSKGQEEKASEKKPSTETKSKLRRGDRGPERGRRGNYPKTRKLEDRATNKETRKNRGEEVAT